MSLTIRSSFIMAAFALLFFCNCSSSRQTPRGSITVIRGSYKINSVVHLPSDSARGQAIVTGHVLDKRTGAPVYLTFIGPKQTDLSILTDRKGYFTFKVPEGKYSLVAKAMSHDSLETKMINFRKDTRTVVTVYLGQRVVH